MTPRAALVALDTPAYAWFFKVLNDTGRRAVQVPLRADARLDLDALERAFADGVAAYVSARGRLDAVISRIDSNRRFLTDVLRHETAQMHHRDPSHGHSFLVDDCVGPCAPHADHQTRSSAPPRMFRAAAHPGQP